MPVWHLTRTTGTGTTNGNITNFMVHTSENKHHVVKGTGGHNFEFHVPKDHHVVAFHGTESETFVTT